MSETFSDRALDFYKTLSFPYELPSQIQLINPYRTPEVQNYLRLFLEKFYGDNNRRVLVLGINPGRFGSGTTGITFTDPVALQDSCGIANTLSRTRERSSEFMYSFIEKWGGAERFYRSFFLSAVSPLGFVNDGVNFNYYDSPELLSIAKPFIIQSVLSQIELGVNRELAILIGSGKNQRFFSELNAEHGFFKTLSVVEHPRFIMQYRRRQLPYYLKKYEQTFAGALTKQ